MHLISKKGYKKCQRSTTSNTKNWQNLGKHEKCRKWYGC